MFVPKEGDFLNIQLPQELIRSVVQRVIDDDTVIVALTVNTPIAKTHSYKRGDFVPAKRQRGMLGEVWAAVDERQLAAAADEERERQAREAAEAERKIEESKAPKPRGGKKKR